MLDLNLWRGLASISMEQALGVWSDLEQAYYGDHGHGGHVAEIYAYRMQPFSPQAMAAGHFQRIPKKERHRIGRQALSALYELCALFEEWRACDIEIDGVPMRKWVSTRVLFEHRCKVKVIPARPGGDSADD